MDIKRTYLITKEQITVEFGLRVEDYMKSGSDINPFIISCYDELSTFIISHNSSLRDDERGGNEALKDKLLSNTWMEFPMHKAQAKLMENKLSFGPGSDPFDRTLMDIIQGDLNIILANGWQKGV